MCGKGLTRLHWLSCKPEGNRFGFSNVVVAQRVTPGDLRREETETFHYLYLKAAPCRGLLPPTYHKTVNSPRGFRNPSPCTLVPSTATATVATMINRRNFLLGSGAVSAAAVMGLIPSLFSRNADAQAKSAKFDIMLTDAQWHQRLNDDQYRILREAGTERPYSSPLNNEHRAGEFACAGCNLPLFSSATKFDSHTGWPSFWKPLPDSALTSRDTSFGMVRDEVHCRRCGGHLGHVFDDGPQPTGLRYCMNGLAMTFTPNV